MQVVAAILAGAAMALVAFNLPRRQSATALAQTQKLAGDESWKKSIKEMWDRRKHMGIPDDKKKSASHIPGTVWSIPGHQWHTDPNIHVQMGIGGGLSRRMRRMTVRRQWAWRTGPEAAGQPNFIKTGDVPPKIPILGNAKMMKDEFPDAYKDVPHI